MAETFTTSVTLPAGMLEQMQRRAKELQFHDVQFYVRWLVAKDVAPESEAANLVSALIHEGEMSPAREFDEAYKQEILDRTNRIIHEAEARSKRAVG